MTVEGHVRPQVSRRQICCRKSDTGTGFSPSTFVCPLQFIPPSPTHSSPTTRCSYQRRKRAKSPGKNSEKQSLFGNLRALNRQVLSNFSLTFWRRNFFQILAHSVFKMWVIQKPNKVALWNKWHSEEKKWRSYSMFKYSVRIFVE